MEKLNVKQQTDKALGRLRTLRDDIRVRIHLGGMDLQDTLRDLEARMDTAERTAKHASEELLVALQNLETKFVQLGDKIAARVTEVGCKDKTACTH